MGISLSIVGSHSFPYIGSRDCTVTERASSAHKYDQKLGDRTMHTLRSYKEYNHNIHHWGWDQNSVFYTQVYLHLLKKAAPMSSFLQPGSWNLSKGIYFFTGWAGQIMTELLESIQINFKKLTKCKEQWNCTSTSDTRLTGLSAEVDPKRVGSSEKVKPKTPNGNPVQ